VPSLLLIVYVLVTARIPQWATTSLIAVAGIGTVFFVAAVFLARRERVPLHGAGTVRKVINRARLGLGVMRAPLPALVAVGLQSLGWLCQFFAVWMAMQAFNLDLGFPAAGLVLVLINVATILPLWPGNVGVTQAAIAFPLKRYYGVPLAKGIGFGIGLQAIEASVGIGVGLVFLAREGLSFATLRGMQQEPDEEIEELEEVSVDEEPERADARVPG
jgi:uncharacterized membrane protein YbhN (UPF0104 family)